MREVWKDIKDYEGLYQVSNLGRIKSLSRFHYTGWGKNKGYIKKEKILTQTLLSIGYYIVTLCKNGESKKMFVHRLVAQAFLDNLNNFPCINHKDENKLNNYVDNLEWCTHCYNNNYGTKKERIAKNVSIKINQYDLNGNFIKTWNNAKEVGETFKKNSTHICQVCNGKRKTTLGFKWNYCREEE